MNDFHMIEQLEHIFSDYEVENHKKNSFSLLKNEKGMLGETILIVIDETGIFTYRHPFKGHSDITTLEEYHTIESHYAHMENYSRFRSEPSLKTPLFTIYEENRTFHRADGFVNGFSKETRERLERTFYHFLSSLIELAS